MYVCMYVCMYACMYACIYVSMYVRVYACTFVGNIYTRLSVSVCIVCECMCVRDSQFGIVENGANFFTETTAAN